MNAKIKRLAIPAGVAAVIGTTGFAFMANNAVDASSAGQGQATVSGYTVSGITYSTEQGWGKPAPTYSVSTVKFILTSAATSSPANGKPANVNAALLGTSANTSDCTIVNWTIDSNGHGTSPVVCDFHAVQPDVQDVTGLNVEANQ
jgi:hypothetical protein